MSFTPLNKREETEHDIEKHIREVELENALKLYQDALRLHYKESWSAAADAYDSLLASDVLQDVLKKGVMAEREYDLPSSSTAQSSVTLLPYLIFKNHGSLLLDRLKSELVHTDRDVVQNTVQQVIMEYATALSFDGDDKFLWRRVSKLSLLLNLYRVSRFALEAELANSAISSGSQHGLLWDEGSTFHQQFAKRKLQTVLNVLGDRVAENRIALGDSTEDDATQNDGDLSWLTAQHCGTDGPHVNSTVSIQVLNVRPANCSWYALARALVEKHRVAINYSTHLPIHFNIDVPGSSMLLEAMSEDSTAEAAEDEEQQEDDVSENGQRLGTSGSSRCDVESVPVKLTDVSCIEAETEIVEESHSQPRENGENGAFEAIREDLSDQRREDDQVSDSEISQDSDNESQVSRESAAGDSSENDAESTVSADSATNDMQNDITFESDRDNNERIHNAQVATDDETDSEGQPDYEGKTDDEEQEDHDIGTDEDEEADEEQTDEGDANEEQAAEEHVDEIQSGEMQVGEVQANEEKIDEIQADDEQADDEQVDEQHADEHAEEEHGNEEHENDEQADDEDRGDSDDLAEAEETAEFHDLDNAGEEGNADHGHDFDISGVVRSPGASVVGSSTASRKRGIHESDSEADEANTRVSKRVRQRASASYSSEDNNFQHVLEDLFADIDLQTLFDLESEAPESINFHAGPPTLYSDFKSLLYFDWSDERVRGARVELNPQEAAFSKSMMFNYPSLTHPRKDPECERSHMLDFANRIERGQSYHRQVNVELLLTLLGTDQATGKSPYTERTWSVMFRAIVMKLFTSEEILLQLSLDNLLDPAAEADSVSLLFALSWTQALLELCLDDLVASETIRLEGPITSERNLALFDRAYRWRIITSILFGKASATLTSHYNLAVRQQWTCISLSQLSGTSVDDTVRAYHELSSVIRTDGTFHQMTLPNCRTINSVGLQALELEISKFSTLEFFEEVFDSTRSLDHKSVLIHLEPVLMNGDSTSPEASLVKDYLSRTPHQFRLQLWSMLSAAFISADRKSDAILSWTNSTKLLWDMMVFNAEQEATKTARQDIILRGLEQVSGLLKSIVAAIEDRPSVIEEWAQVLCSSSLQVMFTILPLLQIFVFYEDSASEDSSYARSSLTFIQFRDRMRADYIRLWTFIYHISRQYITLTGKEQSEIDHSLAVLINILHDELGSRGYCTLLNGSILELFEDEIFRLDRAETEMDLVQILHCRYGISYHVGSLVPWDHYAQETDLSVTRALRIVPFVLTFVLEKSPGVWLPKVDVKDALQKLHRVVWPSLENLRIVSRNRNIVDAFIQHEIRPTDFRRCLVAALSIEANDVKNPTRMPEKQWIAVSKLSLMLGRIHLSMYKARNKNNVKGISDLEQAQKYFQLDLYLTPSCSESWQSLAYINSALADNELSFDALRIWDHRNDISGLQREMILCYMMAISLSLRSIKIAPDEEGTEAVSFANLLFEFGFQLYNCARGPLPMACFARSELKYMERGDAQPQIELLPGVDSREAMQVASRCLYRAAKECTEKWRCYLYLGKAHEKLKVRATVALDDYKNAVLLAPSHSAAESGRLLDPHYKLMASVYKSLIKDDIDPAVALAYLGVTSFAHRHVQDCLPEKQEVIGVIQASLNDLCIADKKHWHHRPVYRLAKLAYELPPVKRTAAEVGYNPVDAARMKIESLFTAKGAASNLLSIWRPEFERPGRHYLYAYRYTDFYIDLLLEQQDIDSLRNLLRRLRKANANLWNHKRIWDKLCSNFISLSIEKNEIPEEDLSLFVDVIEINVFNTGASRLEQATTQADFSPGVLRALRDVYELRKVNGGLFDTNAIDDAIIHCYIVLYQKAQSMSASLLGLPGTNQTTTGSVDSVNTLSTDVRMTSLERDRGNEPFARGVAVTDIATPTAVVTPKPKGRPKEPKIIRVSRRDILSKSFALCRPKPSVLVDNRNRSESIRGRTRASSTNDDIHRRTGSVASGSSGGERNTRRDELNRRSQLRTEVDTRPGTDQAQDGVRDSDRDGGAVPVRDQLAGLGDHSSLSTLIQDRQRLEKTQSWKIRPYR